MLLHKGTSGKGLLFRKCDNRKISCYADADWVGSVEDNKSITCYFTKLWGNLVTWRRKKQLVVARSSVEAKYKAIIQGICELIWLERLLQALGIVKDERDTKIPQLIE